MFYNKCTVHIDLCCAEYIATLLMLYVRGTDRHINELPLRLGLYWKVVSPLLMPYFALNSYFMVHSMLILFQEHVCVWEGRMNFGRPCHRLLRSPILVTLTHEVRALHICQWTGSSLLQIMACCLTAPSHYLNQCWLSVNWVIIASDNGLLPNSTKPLPEPMLTVSELGHNCFR